MVRRLAKKKFLKNFQNFIKNILFELISWHKLLDLSLFFQEYFCWQGFCWHQGFYWHFFGLLKMQQKPYLRRFRFFSGKNTKIFDDLLIFKILYRYKYIRSNNFDHFRSVSTFWFTIWIIFSFNFGWTLTNLALWCSFWAKNANSNNYI